MPASGTAYSDAEIASVATARFGVKASELTAAQGSRFHQEYGYYAQGVDERTAILPRGWRDRLITVSNTNTGGVVGLCLEVHDLAISKYVAGRSKDLGFTKELAKHSMTSLSTLLTRVDETDVTLELRDIIRARIKRDFSKLSSR